MSLPMPAETNPPVTSSEAIIVDGKATAATIRLEIAEEVKQLHESHSITPGIGVIIVGDRPDSATYVRMKLKAANEVGIKSIDIHLPEDSTEEQVLEAVAQLNERADVHGILVQLPLPKHVDEAKVLSEIKVEKDADGFSASNIGNLCLRGGVPPLAVPCTPAGCVELLQRYGYDCRGKHAVVIGRSNIVGMPVAHLLQTMDATVTVCHSRTNDIASFVRQADIVVAAVGRANYVRGDWIKPGAFVIDVGINSVDDATRKRGYRLVGDVCFDEAKTVAGYITPVPGGVGPMTIAMLLKNTLNLARHSVGLPRMPLRKLRATSDIGITDIVHIKNR